MVERTSQLCNTVSCQGPLMDVILTPERPQQTGGKASLYPAQLIYTEMLTMNTNPRPGYKKRWKS